ncbi:MAG: hypothetical protein K940chlam1_00763 [Candidatus Anoxychlamydiales bacterium]|nr:hypothetical protein [Candidatus Anoxychlamydiales bacterium]NGX35459.1 hypothetical protein [Candidatus Anoxychlamydiales bacterium]
MGRFIFWLVVFIFLSGISLHYRFDVPYFLSWIGKLPGDMIIKKGKTLFYFPITTSALASLVLTIVLSAFSGKK